jgi:hypothetical protein
MSTTKFIGLSILPLLMQSMNKEKKVNECHVDAHAQQDADALAKIFEEGGGMMDQHEMMEMMMNKKGDLKPYPFEKLMQNTAMFK